LARAVGILVGALAVLALALPAGALAKVAPDPQTIYWGGWPTSATNGQPDFWIEAHGDAGTFVTMTAEGSCDGVGWKIDADDHVSILVETTSMGKCTIRASAPGNNDFYSVVTYKWFLVDPGEQQLIFETDPSTWHGSWGGTIEMPVNSFNLRHEPTGLPVEVRTSTPLVCTPSQAYGTNWVTVKTSGTCTVWAYQAGNNDYRSTTSDTYSFVIGKVAQTITFLPIPNKMPGDQFSLANYVWASSGRQVTLTSSEGCGVGQYQVYVSLGVGSCTITAQRDADDQYAAAPAVPQKFYFGAVGARAGAMADSQWRSSAPLDRYGADGQGYDWSTGEGDWCADFAHWAWTQGGVYIPWEFESGPDHWRNPVSGYNHTWAQWFRDYGTYTNRHPSTPSIGDAVWFGTQNAVAEHVAIVTYVYPNGNIDIVGGNQFLRGNPTGLVTKVTNVSSAIGTEPAGIGLPIGGYVEPLPTGTTTNADATYSMKTDQVATGSFTVAASAGSSSNLDIIVGPFFSNVDVQLHRPNGTLVSPSDPGVTFTRLANSIKVSISGADPGVWTYEIDALQLEPGGEDIHIQATTTPVITTTVSQEPAESQYLQPATFTAFVSSSIDGGPAPTGNVQFNLDGNPAGTPVALDAAGQATWTTSSLSVGSHTVSVDYLGSSQFVAPSSATITHVVTKADQTLTFGALASKTYGDADFTVSATASSGLTATFAAGGTCTVTGSTVHIVGAGSCTITASQAGDGNYNAAADVVQSFDIAKANQAITFGALGGKTYGDPDFTISANASSGLAVTFAAAGDCTDSGTTVHILAAGSCTITASQPGNANYNPAPDVPQTLSIAKKALTITAKAATKSYGQTLTFAGTEFTLVGLVPGDGVTSVTLTSAGQPAGAQPGSYPIVASTALGNRLSNYDISYVNGTLTVNLVAIVGLDGVTISGGSTIDSYNGANGPYSSKTKLSAAFVVSNGSISMDGSPAIRGDVRSTRGSISLTGGSLVTGNAYAGATIATRSLVRGSASPNSPLAALIAPAVAACSPYSSSAGLSGSYTYNAKTGNLSVSGANTLTLANGTYCFGSITLSGSAKLVVNGPVILRLTGQFTADGATITNLTNNAANLQISTSYAGNNGVVLAGSGGGCFSVYAPVAQVVLSGAAQISGPVLGKSITLTGSAAIHQDTSAIGVWAGYFQK
jgi:hypothetical protein